MIKKIFVTTLFIAGSLFFSCKSTKVAPAAPAEPTAEEIAADEEFNRSTNGVEITREEFNADKNEILRIISELSVIMSEQDFDSWIKYIDKDSISYYSNPKNLQNASKRIPQKIKLANLNDYFKYVFIPSRKGRSVEEIRYISRDSVKAVQVREDRDIVYYNFERNEGKWLINLPEL